MYFCCFSLATGIGLIYSVTLGAHLTWPILSFVASVPPLLLFLSSPFLVVSKADDRTTIRSLVHPLSQPPTAPRPLLLLCFLAAMFVFSGMCPLSVFPEMLFNDERTISKSDLVIASMMCQVMGGILGAVFIDKLGRKPVLQVF